MKGEFRAQLPGNVEGEYYVVSISYSGEGRFNGQDIVDRHPRAVGDITYWDNIEKLRASAMTIGLTRIISDDKYASLEELANSAFRNGMNGVARAFPHGAGYNDDKADSGV